MVRFTPLLAVLLASAAPRSVSSQYQLPIGGGRPSLHVEVTKPFVSKFGPFAGARLRTSIWDASVVVPLEGAPTLFARMGVVYAHIEGLAPSMTIGKPRFGAMVGDAHRLAEIHVDVPVGSEYGEDYATGVGIFADYEELERFETEAWSFGASTSLEWETPTPNAYVGVRAGATLVIPDGGSDAYGVIGLFAQAPTVETRFRFEISAVALASRSDLGFDQRTAFFASLEIARPNASGAPTAFVRLPFDERIERGVALVGGVRFQIGG
jgi:hypothetical protein